MSDDALRTALRAVLEAGHADVNSDGGRCRCVVHEDARAALEEPSGPRDGLDVERLARAIERWYRTPVNASTTAPHDSAMWIAAAYDKQP